MDLVKLNLALFEDKDKVLNNMEEHLDKEFDSFKPYVVLMFSFLSQYKNVKGENLEDLERKSRFKELYTLVAKQAFLQCTSKVDPKDQETKSLKELVDKIKSVDLNEIKDKLEKAEKEN